MKDTVRDSGFFTERLAPFYRPFCLTLLMSLAGLGLVRTHFA